MSDARKAEASDWSFIENGSLIDAKPFSLHRALIELRARVEALEAQQRKGCRPLNTETVYGSEPAVDTVQLHTCSVEPAKPIGHTLVEAEQPGGLVESVEDALIDCPHPPGTLKPEARSAIRAVAAWFTTIAPHGSEAWRMASEVLLQEAGNG